MVGRRWLSGGFRIWRSSPTLATPTVQTGCDRFFGVLIHPNIGEGRLDILDFEASMISSYPKYMHQMRVIEIDKNEDRTKE